MTLSQADHIDPAALLAWHVAMGADEACADEPIDRYSTPAAEPAPQQAAQDKAQNKPKERPQGPTPIVARPAKPATGAGPEIAAATAAACSTIQELFTALAAFDGGLVKRSAKNTVLSDGTFGADLMVIGDVPSREDDQEGLSFQGPSGALLDKMLAAIGLRRSKDAYLSNVLPWRLLGNSKPDEALLAVCKPFVERHIQLAKPKIVLFMGGAAAKSLTGTADSISRQRGKWLELTLGEQTFAALPTYHPTYLLNQPHQKRAAWADLLATQKRLSL
ncbi:MAG: uracil-DNA glycosylase [Kordiimonadales bacterium]|nr:MAG: uracil-DNA glycosylase [Kordiimonadales bacterium]